MSRASHALILLCALVALSCGGKQSKQTTFETRPLGETEALEIIKEVLAERGYADTQQVDVVLKNGVQFNCDIRAVGHPMCVEYVTEQDRTDMGLLPPPADGSRLHVLRSHTLSADPQTPGELIYVFFIDNRNFVYHFNPTSEVRANVTFLDVDARLRRDLADFISWYEKDIAKR